MKKRLYIVGAVAVLLVLAVCLQYPVLSALRPDAVPPDAAPCWFGLRVQWIRCDEPMVGSGLVSVYDWGGKVVDRERLILAKPPMIPASTTNRGYQAYSYEEFPDFGLPENKVFRGRGLGDWNELSIRVDGDRRLVPFNWFR